MRSEVLRDMNIEITVFWDVMPCAFIDRYPVVEEPAACFALMLEAVGSSETLVSLHQTTRHHIPKDSNLRSLAVCGYL
jgi:hypothetical protein